MFADLEGSTDFIARLGSQQAQPVIDQYTNLITEIIGDNCGGRIRAQTGDGIFATFSSPSTAISCALAIQRSVHALNCDSQPERHLRVRIGLHQGELLCDESDGSQLVSPHINCAQRVMSAADGGQILMTQAVYEGGKEFVEGVPSEHLSWAEHGTFVLKGIGPMELYEATDVRVRSPRPPSQKKAVQVHRLDARGYVNLERVGEGGMGVVYRGERKDGERGRKLAIKVLGRGLQEKATAREQFAREAHVIAKLNHPNIVRVVDIHLDTEPPFFVMDWIEGAPITEACRSWEWKRKATVLATVCDAIAYAHQQGVTHRDLKPRNILVSQDDAPVVLDFGLHLGVDRDSSGTATSATFLGTPLYLSPEQARNDPRVGPGADVYSLGAILYELLTGQPPFTGETLFEILNGHLFEDPRLPRSGRPDIPEELQRICMKALEKDPSDRYATTAQMGDDLRRFVRGEAVTVRPKLYDNFIGRRVHRHMSEVGSWHRRGLITALEHARLLRAYRPFSRSGLAAVMEPRTLHFVLLMLYLGGWLAINGADLWLVHSYQFDEGNSIGLRAKRMIIGFLPLVLTTVLWVVLWRRGRYRAAFVFMILGVISLPTAIWPTLHETEFLKNVRGEHIAEVNGVETAVAPGIFSDQPGTLLEQLKLSFGQWAAMLGGSLAWTAALAYRSRTVTLSTLTAIFATLFTAVLLDYHNLTEAKFATTALRCLPLLVAFVAVGWFAARVLQQHRLSMPWFVGALLLLIFITQSVALLGPEQWEFISKPMYEDPSARIHEMKNSFEMQRRQVSAANLSGPSIGELDARIAALDQDLADLTQRVPKLKCLLQSICGVLYLLIGLALRRRLTVEAHETSLCLLWLAPLSFLGGIAAMGHGWPDSWTHITMYGKPVPLPVWILLACSIGTVFYASRIQVRFFFSMGLLFSAGALWALGEIFFSGIHQWPRTVMIAGLIVTTIAIVIELRRRHAHTSDDTDDVLSAQDTPPHDPHFKP